MFDRAFYYILDEAHNVIAISDLMAWGQWFEENDALRRVGSDIINGIRVSTVFLGLDHNYGSGAPLLFETMIFDKSADSSLNGMMWRYSTWAEAEEGHKAAVRTVRAAFIKKAS